MPERPHPGLICLATSVLIAGFIGRVSASELDEMNEYARRFLRPGYTVVDMTYGGQAGTVIYLLVTPDRGAKDLSKKWEWAGDRRGRVNHHLMEALRGCKLGRGHPGHLGMLLTALLDGPHSTAHLGTSRSYSSRDTPSGKIWTVEVRRRDGKFQDLGPLCSYELTLNQEGEVTDLRKILVETDSPTPTTKPSGPGRQKSKAWWRLW